MSISTKTNENILSGFINSKLDINLSNKNNSSNFVNTPFVNMRELGDAFYIELVVPGFETEDFELEVDDETLVIKMEKYLVIEDNNDNYSRKEFHHRKFSHSIVLPENSLPEDIEVKYSAEIIELKLPKKFVI